VVRAEVLVDELARVGFGIISGVPCSYLTPLINTAIANPHMRYVGAANEGDAVAIACGAQVGGIRGVTIFQNSGLGNAVNPLTSLTSAFALPVLLVCSWRGQPEGPADEPQHGMMGRITPDLFELMGIPWERFPTEESELAHALGRAVDHMDRARGPYALIVPKGTIGGGAVAPPPPQARSATRKAVEGRFVGGTPIDPDAALASIQDGSRDDDVLVATTGFTGRALYALADRPNQLYMVGSMGCASSMGLGLALTRPERRIVVIDGDGAMLMRMGAVATIGFEAPGNLLHVLLDNGVHDSTGAQATVSASTDLSEIALACGYASARRVADVTALRDAVSTDERGPRFLHVRTRARTNRKLPRPTVRPDEVAERLRRWLGPPMSTAATS